MWKKIRYVLYFAVLISVFSVTYNFREYFYVPFIQKSIDKISGSKVKIRNFSFDFPFEASFYDIKYDNKIFIDKATLRFEPVKFLKNITSPLKSLVALKVGKFVYIKQCSSASNSLPKKENLSLIRIKIYNKIFEMFNINVFVDKAFVIYDKNILKAVNTDISLDKHVNVKTELSFLNHKIFTEGTLKLEDIFVISDFYTEVDGTINTFFDLNGIYNISDKTLDYDIETKALFVNKLRFGKSKTKITKNNLGITVNSSGEFGKLSFNAADLSFAVWKSSGSVILRDANDVVNTTVDYSAEMNNKILDLAILAKDAMLFGNNFGSLDIKADNDNNELNLDCYHHSGNRFKTTVQKDGNYVVDVYTKKIKTGRLHGNYKRGEVSVNIKNIPIKKFPFLSSFNKSIKGQISLYGTIGSDSGSIFLEAKHLASKKLKQFDILGKISKENSKWYADIATKDKKLVMKGFYETKKKNNIEFYYSGVDSNNLLQILGFNKPALSGKMTGSVKYSSDNLTTKIDINFKKGVLYGNKFNTWSVFGEVSPNKINVSTFSFLGPETSVDFKTLVDFNKMASDSFLKCSIKNFHAGLVNVNYNLDINGKFSESSNEIFGDIKVSKLQLNDFNFQHTAKMALSNKRINITNIDNGNGLSGEMICDFKTRNISVTLKTIKAKLSQHYKNIKGRLNSTITVNGDIINPAIAFTGKISNALYNDVSFDSDIKITHKNNMTRLNNLQISAGKERYAKINASGVIKKNTADIKIDFKGLSEQIINKYIGFRTPFKGVFYGDGTVSGKVDDLKILLNLYADTVFIKSLKFHSFSSKTEIKRHILAVKDAKIKFSDSEIEILSAQFNTKTDKYKSVFKFVNTHLGPFDIFGNIRFDGTMTKKRNGSLYNGNIELENLWLNEERVDSLILKYVIADKIFTFKTNDADKLKIMGKINFNKYPKMQFKDISIAYGKQSYKFNGTTMSDTIDINMNGKNLDLSVLTGIFNSSVDMNGAVNVNLKASGDISKPNIDFTLASSKGSILNVPFDFVDISADVKDNILSINKFDIQKKGKYNVKASGSFPFWLDSKLKEQMMKKKVKINYEVNDTSLYIINNLTENKLSAKKGSFKILGTLSGMRKNISNTGEMTISGSNIKSDYYINKIKNLDVDIWWENSLFKIKEFTAKAGSGIVKAEGSVRLKGINPSFYDLTLFTSKKGVPVVIHELPIPTSGIFKMESNQTFANFSKGIPKFNFNLRGKPENLKLTGWMELENMRFCYPSPVKNENIGISDFASEMFKNLYINIDLKTGNSTRYENSYVNLFLKGSVNIKGKLDEIVANGVVGSNEGMFSYMGNDFNIVNSKIEIINNEIFLTGEAETDVYSTGDSAAEVIKVYIDRSDIKNIKTRFASKNDPTMDSKKALARLTKTDPAQSSALDTSTDFLVKQQAIRLFGSNIATPLANTVLKKTGIVDNVRLGFVNQDTLQISSDQEPTMAELLYGMKYSVEKNLNRLLQVGYSVTFDKVQREIDLKHALEMSFKVNRNLFLKGSYGLQSENPQYEPEKKLMIEQRLRF